MMEDENTYVIIIVIVMIMLLIDFWMIKNIWVPDGEGQRRLQRPHGYARERS
tara:strand:+ start:197 stop:352 length:156 start_codon:yes stop_codon:yes gene_type:complete